jgi:hypothetical protein
MPEHLRALVIVLILASMIFALARRPLSPLIDDHDFVRRRNIWLGLTMTAFLAHDFWLYFLVASLVLFFSSQREHNRIALFFLLLFLIPPVTARIPGLGMINYLIEVNHIRLLLLVVLLPALLAIQHRRETVAFGRNWPDRLLAAYLLLSVALQLREDSLTNFLRIGFYQYIDVFLPYYVISRTLTTVQAFKDALSSFVLAVMALSAIGLFESTRHWLLYPGLVEALGLNWEIMGYLGRSGILRASATTGQAIVLGYVMAVAIGFYLFIKNRIASSLYRYLFGTLLTLGLIAPLSRGPWIGACVMVIIFIAMGNHAARRLIMLTMIGITSIFLLASLPGGQRFVDLLPFIGETEKSTIDYRERLLGNAMAVIDRNPWFGSIDYLNSEEMQALSQGAGLIDLVNTYLQVALENGYVGLFLFVGFFATALYGTHKAMRYLTPKDHEIYRLGQSILATQAGILVIIFTVSSISVIPIIYWSVAGLCVAYIQLTKQVSYLEK